MKTLNAILTSALLLAGGLPRVSAQVTEFRYQGRLNDGANPANGTYEIAFRPFDVATGGAPLAPANTRLVDAVSGLFTTTLDFGSSLFDGNPRYLQLEVRSNGAAAFTILAPRQQVTPVPYSIFSSVAATVPGGSITASKLAANSVSAASLQNNSVLASKIPNGQVVRNLNGLQDGVTLAAGANTTLATSGNTLTIAGSSDWTLGGNAGTTPGVHFLGTTDNQPLVVKTFNQRALRLEPTAALDTVNVIGGSARNFVGVGVVGATIGGGGSGNYGGLAYTNRVEGIFGTVSGGAQNAIEPQAEFGTIGGGAQNTIQKLAGFGTIAGGRENTIQTNAPFATIPGGRGNSATNYAFAAGRRAKANHTGAFVWADATDADFASTAANQFLIRATGGVGVNKPNPATALDVNGIVTATGFSGNGAGLTNLNATDLVGTISNARLSPNVALRAGGNAFTGNQTIAGNVGIGTLNPGAKLDVAGPAGTSVRVTGPGGLGTMVAFDLATYDPGAGNGPSARIQATHNNFSSTLDFLTKQPGAANNPLRLRLQLNLDGHVNIDPAAANDGAIVGQPALAFGDAGSGEGIASKRTGGGNQWGLDFYTQFLNRMTILNDGNVGIGTISPSTKLEVNGIVTAAGFSGNVDTPLLFGTTGSGGLLFKVNNYGGLRLEAGGGYSVNTIGGWSGNSVPAGVVGATVAGGGAGDYFGLPYTNRVEADFGTVSGGAQNTIETASICATIGGGLRNRIQNDSKFSNINGGDGNMIESVVDDATIGGGSGNLIKTYGKAATIGGGRDNTIQSFSLYATIGGGRDNTIQVDAKYATIGGGYQNTNRGNYATVPGGHFNSATGGVSFAAGYRAKAYHDGAFVWGDSTEADFRSTANNQFLIRATGGVGIGMNNPQAPLNVNGSARIDALPFGYGEGLILNLPTDMPGNGYGGIHFHNAARGGTLGAGTIKWGLFYNYSPETGTTGDGLAFVQNNANTRLYLASSGNVGIGTTSPNSALQVIGTVCATQLLPCSDRNMKENFTEISPREVLDKVAALTVSRWNFKGDTATPHVGPMAQDFHAAFGLGADDKHIATVDADGVALAAIQGLNQKVEGEVTALRAENAELKQRLEELEQRMNRQNGGVR